MISFPPFNEIFIAQVKSTSLAYWLYTGVFLIRDTAYKLGLIRAKETLPCKPFVEISFVVDILDRIENYLKRKNTYMYL